MHKKKQNFRLKQKKKLRHLALIKNNKLKTLNYKNSILENTWLGQVNKDFSVHINKDKVINELKEKLQKIKKINSLKKKLNIENKNIKKKNIIEKKENNNIKEEHIIEKNENENNNIEYEYIQITKNDLNYNLQDDTSRCVIC